MHKSTLDGAPKSLDPQTGERTATTVLFSRVFKIKGVKSWDTAGRPGDYSDGRLNNVLNAESFALVDALWVLRVSRSDSRFRT